ncbi:hypothetical protein [Pseudarthrobacter scleromae]|uniref:hypothetical protein n=1 Tax=Pseudarthrobacter scleromae TaxID=158897 RepID=UPI003D0370C9
MDGETIRLIVVALGGIVAGVSGSVITGAFSSQNTESTIAAARHAAETQREADRDMEHERWLRDRKVQCYTNFLSHLRELERIVSDFHERKRLDTKRITEMTQTLANDELMLIAPRHIYNFAGRVVADAVAIVRTATEAHSNAEQSPAYRGAVDDFIARYSAFERLIRADLGAED